MNYYLQTILNFWQKIVLDLPTSSSWPILLTSSALTIPVLTSSWNTYQEVWWVRRNIIKQCSWLLCKILCNFLKDWNCGRTRTEDFNWEILHYKDNLLLYLHVWKPLLEPWGEASDTQNVREETISWKYCSVIIMIEIHFRKLLSTEFQTQ